jgi:hypothetical protein
MIGTALAIDTLHDRAAPGGALGRSSPSPATCTFLCGALARMAVQWVSQNDFPGCVSEILEMETGGSTAVLRLETVRAEFLLCTCFLTNRTCHQTAAPDAPRRKLFRVRQAP